MRNVRNLALAVSAAAMLAVPAVSAAPASAAGPDPVELAGQVVDCGKDTVVAYWRAINGYPQMYYCEFG